jgi:hypothetical protein
MLLGPMLLTWILVGTVSTVQCKGTVCQPTRTSQAVAGPHKMAVFHSLAACERYRSTMQQLPGFSANNPPLHVHERAPKSFPGAGLRAGAGD